MAQALGNLTGISTFTIVPSISRLTSFSISAERKGWAIQETNVGSSDNYQQKSWQYKQCMHAVAKPSELPVAVAALSVLAMSAESTVQTHLSQ